MKLPFFQIKPTHIILLTILGLLPWAWVQISMALNTNHAWLFVAAKRLLAGGNHLHDVYEPNPPLSILLYYPPVLISHYISLAAEYSIYLFGIGMLGFSTAILWFLLKPLEAITRNEKALACAVYFIAGCIIPSNIFFAERDEFVLWGLVPFMLSQIMITRGYVYQGAFYNLAIFVSALLILIKPHYILLPALLFLHRLAVKRNVMGFLKFPDVWAMVLACLAYLLTATVFYPDYFHEILPALLDYYISYTSDGVFSRLKGPLVLIIIIMSAVSVLHLDRFYAQVIYVLLLAAILSFGLYALQMKGFGYHLIPGKIFLFLAGMVFVYAVLRKVLPSDHGRQVSVLGLALLTAYMAVPLKVHSHTHESYSKLMLPQIVKSCGSPCPFFIFVENMEMIWQTSIYSGENHASRFPGLWWLHSMLEHGYTAEEHKKYTDMLAEDLQRYNPKMLIIATNLNTVHGKTFSFTDFFSANERFRQEMSRYKLEKKFKDDRGLYFKGTNAEYFYPIEYDVYLRK